jgi:hypothetical protein
MAYNTDAVLWRPLLRRLCRASSLNEIQQAFQQTGTVHFPMTKWTALQEVRPGKHAPVFPARCFTFALGADRPTANRLQ